MVTIAILLLGASFIGYDTACYRLIRLVKGPNEVFKYFGVIPGYSMYYYHKHIKPLKRKPDETEKSDS
jgi:hypothetical protein